MNIWIMRGRKVIIRNIILAVWGISGGLMVAAGICALVTTINFISRLALKTNTAYRVKNYENMLFCGAFIGNSIYFVYPVINLRSGPGNILLGIIGGFWGIYVGCLAMSLAEALDASTVFFRRIGLKKHIKVVIFGIIIGKILGNWIFWHFMNVTG